GGFGGVGGTAGLGGAGGAGGVGGAGGTGGSTEQPPTAHPPPDPGGPPAGGTQVSALVVQKLFLGDTDRQLLSDPNAWKTYGYDLDGHFSNKNSTAHCTPQKGANPASVKTDGNGGVDNSFGANIVPILKSFTSSPTADIISSIQDGNGTMLFRFVGLATGPNQSPLTAGFLNAAPFSGTPAWNGSDAWPITAESVNGSAAQPKVTLASYVSGGTWVGHASGPIAADLQVFGSSWPLTIHQGLITADISGSGTAMVGTNGIIAGVLDTEELIQALKKVAGAFDPNLCNGATFDSIAQQFRAASDIMKDGSNGDPSLTCDGISVGFGFESIAANVGSVAAPVPPVPDPCVN
ncbi:MAG: hypothetical protein KC776_16330, partial [Myxococcales bacterium]|nr:hypothetical protein [Myxococcales bacterium]